MKDDLEILITIWICFTIFAIFVVFLDRAFGREISESHYGEIINWRQK